MPVQPGTLSRRQPDRQFRLDLGDPPRTARHRPVQPQREDDQLYRSVRALRAAGRKVYRAGALYSVDGCLLTTKELLMIENAQRWGGATARS